MEECGIQHYINNLNLMLENEVMKA